MNLFSLIMTHMKNFTTTSQPLYLKLATNFSSDSVMVPGLWPAACSDGNQVLRQSLAQCEPVLKAKFTLEPKLLCGTTLHFLIPLQLHNKLLLVPSSVYNHSSFFIVFLLAEIGTGCWSVAFMLAFDKFSCLPIYISSNVI